MATDAFLRAMGNTYQPTQAFTGMLSTIAGKIKDRQIRDQLGDIDLQKDPEGGFNKLAQFYTSQGDFQQALQAVQAGRQHRQLAVQESAEERLTARSEKELAVFDEQAQVERAYKQALTESALAQAKAYGARATQTPFERFIGGIDQATAVVEDPSQSTARQEAASFYIDKATGLTQPKAKELIPSKTELQQVTNTVVGTDIFGKRVGESMDDAALSTMINLVASDAKSKLINKEAKTWQAAQDQALSEIVDSGMLSLEPSVWWKPEAWREIQLEGRDLGTPGGRPEPQVGIGTPVGTDTTGRVVYQQGDKFIYSDGTEYGG